MTPVFLIYSASMTVALLAMSVYCFIASIPTAGTSLLLFSLVTSLITCNMYTQYSQEQLRSEMIRQMSRIEVVVVPSLLYREDGVIYNIPYAKPVPSTHVHAL